MSKYNKIDPAIKAKWTEALRSGEYQQGPLLHSHGTHCCLGVLCEVVGVPKRVINGSLSDYGPTIYMFAEGETNSVPPYDFCGLGKDTIGKCVTMNDDEMNFDTIADWIEKNL